MPTRGQQAAMKRPGGPADGAGGLRCRDFLDGFRRNLICLTAEAKTVRGTIPEAEIPNGDLFIHEKAE